MNIHRILLTVAVAALIGMDFACTRKSSGNSVLATTIAGREIRAIISGPAFIQPLADAAIVSTPANKITVERERLLLDGKEIAKLPAAATKVELTVVGEQLTVTADGAIVITKALGK